MCRSDSTISYQGSLNNEYIQCPLANTFKAKIYSWLHDEFRISVRQANWSQVLFQEMADYSGQGISHM